MIKCKSKAEFDYLREYYLVMFGSVLANERKRIIYLPNDRIYQKKYLNREKPEKNVCGYCNFCIKDNAGASVYGIKKGKNKKVQLNHICDEYDIHGKRMIIHNRASEVKSE